MGFFSWLINWFKSLSYLDNPQMPWRWGNEDVESLFDHPHTRPLAEFLHTWEPQLLAQWYASVAPSAAEARKAAIALEELRREKNEVAAEVAALEALCTQYEEESQRWNRQSTREQTEKNWEWLLSVGLSLMLFFGIAQILSIDPENLTFQEMPLFSLALLGAICLTLGAKLMIIRWVKATRSYEPKRSFYDDGRYANPVAFWWRIFSGDTAVWLSLAIILLEIAFAGPGLIRLLPPDLRKHLLIQVSAFIGTGIAASINIGLAWGTALNEIRSQTEHLEQQLTTGTQQQFVWLQIYKRKFETRKQVEITKVLCDELIREVEEQKQSVQYLEKIAQREHERWEATVRKRFRRWLNSNPKRWERFQQFHSLLNNNKRLEDVVHNGKVFSKNTGDLK